VSPAFIAIGLTLVVLAVVAAVLALTDGGPLRGAGRRPLPVPAPWIAFGALLLVLGIVIMPRLLGFTFLFLPLIWSRRARRPQGPRGPGRPDGRSAEDDRDRHDEDR